MSLDIVQERFTYLKENKPESGSILTTKDNEPIKLSITRDDNNNISTMVACAVIDSEATGWYLTDQMYGLRILLSPPAQAKILAQFNGDVDKIRITKLKVIRRSNNGRFLICDVV